MKKLIILTSLFAIYACTTGNENERNIQESLTPFDSNGIITGMIQNTDTEHTLDDARFTYENENNYFTFNLDENGKINELRVVDKTTGKDIETYQRYSDQNKFISQDKLFYKYDPKKGDIPHLKDKYTGSSVNEDSLEKLKTALKNEITKLKEDNKITPSEALHANKLIEELNDKSLGMKTEPYKEEVSISSFGKDINLKYSDFGFIKKSTIRRLHKFEEFNVFSGGYNSKNIDKSKITNNLIFKGKAVGLFQNKHSSGETDSLNLVDENATFTFNTDKQSETLNMSFKDWYDVEVKKDNSSENSNSIKFSDIGKTIKGKFKFTNKVNEEQKDFINKSNGRFETNYYGDKNKPSEIVGNISYKEDSGNDTKVFKAAFGGKTE